MDLNNRYWKLVKNYILMIIVFSLVGFVYGAIFNFILSGEDATIFWSCVHGVLVGFLAGIMYMVLTFFFGHCFNQEYVTIKLEKTITILINAIAFVGMCYAITMIISNNEFYIKYTVRICRKPIKTQVFVIGITRNIDF